MLAPFLVGDQVLDPLYSQVLLRVLVIIWRGICVLSTFIVNILTMVTGDGKDDLEDVFFVLKISSFSSLHLN